MTEFDAAALARRDTFTRELGIEVVEAGLGRAVTRVQVEERHVNFNGVCHGGLTFTLADAAFGYACNSHGIMSAGIDVHMMYNTAARVGDMLTATAVETGLTHRTVTRSDGRFVLPALPIGTYRVRAERDGFRPVVRERVVLALGTTIDIDVRLPIAAVQEEVTVTADLPTVDTHSTAVSTTFSQTQIASLPIDGRNFVSFALLTPGVFGDRTPDQGASRSSDGRQCRFFSSRCTISRRIERVGRRTAIATSLPA